MYALVDCNNFYVSCERMFQPQLKGKPVVILSNNDGCVIARSDEAKALGIVMGAPAYMSEKLFRQHNVKVFSSNYTLYGDLSDRVMKTLVSFVPKLELYSIDEAFLDMSELGYNDLQELGIKIRKTVTQNTGIPVSVGIAHTKTLAKMANRYAKKKYKELGVYNASSDLLINEMMEYTQVEDIWGIGKQYSILLRNYGVKSAKDVSKIPPDWMRKKMSVVGLRLWNELNGVPSIEWEYEPGKKKNICTGRSFGSLTNNYSVLKEAVSNYAAICAMKLREQHSVCRYVHVMIRTNPHKPEHKKYEASITVECEVPTSLTKEIIAYALKGLDIIFKPGEYFYMKAEVQVLDLKPDSQIQLSLFDCLDRTNDKQLSKVVDNVNMAMGRDTVKMASQRFDKRYKLRAGKLSKHYTTDIKQILKVKI